MLRALFADRIEMPAGEVCCSLELAISDLQGCVDRLSEMDIIMTIDPWPISHETTLILMQHDLVIGRRYEVFHVSADGYYLLSEGSVKGWKPTPRYYHKGLFEVGDKYIPEGWVVEWDWDGLAIHPPGWDKGFFTGLYEKNSSAMERFTEELKHLFPKTYQRFLDYESQGAFIWPPEGESRPSS